MNVFNLLTTQILYFAFDSRHLGLVIFLTSSLLPPPYFVNFPFVFLYFPVKFPSLFFLVLFVCPFSLPLFVLHKIYIFQS